MWFQNGETFQPLTAEGTVSYFLQHLSPQSSSENLGEVKFSASDFLECLNRINTGL